MTTNGGTYETRALACFHQGYSCAQAVFAPFAAECGLTDEMALKLSAPFGAGIGRMREICGAFCGLSMIAGSLHGNTDPTPDGKERIFNLVQQLADSFKCEFGALHCSELLGLTPEDIARETTRPSDRTAAYYAARPCEGCIAFCARQAALLLHA